MNTNADIPLRRTFHANRVPFAALLVICIAGGCDVGGAKLTDPASAPPPPIKSVAPARVAVSAPTTQLMTSTSLPMSAVALDASGDTLSGESFTWISTDPTVAIVSSNGIVSGQKAGTASITASAGSITSNAVALTVTSPAATVSTIVVTVPASSMHLVQTLQAKAVAYDASGKQMKGITFNWSSSNTAAAVVSQTGLISARLPGVTEITAMWGTAVTSPAVRITVNP